LDATKALSYDVLSTNGARLVYSVAIHLLWSNTQDKLPTRWSGVETL